LRRSFEGSRAASFFNWVNDISCVGLREAEPNHSSADGDFHRAIRGRTSSPEQPSGKVTQQ
jgi:hypothetical protein